METVSIYDSLATLIHLSLRRWMPWRETMHLRQHDSHSMVTGVILSCCEAEWVFITHERDTSLSNTPQPSQESQQRKSCFQPHLSVFSTFSRLCLFLASQLFVTLINLIFPLTVREFCVWIELSSHFGVIKCVNLKCNERLSVVKSILIKFRAK